MGEATPARSEVGFGPMLGVGMVGSLPGVGMVGALPGVGMVGSLPGGVGGGPSRGSAVPQLHSAIVERLRARIELCRRHHQTCENRYQRGQAENSDREHESTLHLLNIVHQGPGNRKTKGSRTSTTSSSTPQPPGGEYSSRVNGGGGGGEQKAQTSSEGEQKISTRIALQGSLRRKLDGHVSEYASKQNGLSCGPSGPDFKRVCMEGGGGLVGGEPCSFSVGGHSQSLPGLAPAMGHNNSLQRKNAYMMPHGVGTDLFHMTLKEMKKEPIEMQSSCGQSSSAESTGMMVFDFKDEGGGGGGGGGHIDPDLQDLFDELTKSVPSLNDLEFEKMLKQDVDAFGLDLGGRPSSAGALQAGLCSQMETRIIKTEYSSPDFGGQNHGCLPQLRPASAGPSFTMGGSSLSTSSSPITSSHKPHGQGPHGPPRPLPSWPEVSHAEQLKQMAANQQQPNNNNNNLLHHHHQQPGGGGGGGTSWATARGTHPSSTFPPQEKLSGSAPLGQQNRIGPGNSVLRPMSAGQCKGIVNNNNNNCLFKPNGPGGSKPMDMKVLSSKPMLHFSPKAPPAPPSAGQQQIPIMAGPLSKTAGHQQQQQQQPATTAQNQPHPALHYQNPQMPMPGAPCLGSKPGPQRPPLNQNHGPGLHFKLAQQRQHSQVMTPGPRLPSNGMAAQAQTQQRPPAPNSQQKAPGQTQTQTQALQRQLAQQQHIINDSDKGSTQDQFNRHLTRPPPDYKQPRSMVGGPQPTLFTGLSSSQSLPSNGSDQSDLQSLTCHLPPNPAVKMSPTSSDRRFGSGPDPHQQLQQHNNNNQNRIGLNQNKPRFPGPNNNQGNNNNNHTFGVSNVTNVQHPRTTAGGQQPMGMSAAGQGLGVMTNANMGWAPGAKQANVGLGSPGLGVRRLPNPLDMAGHHYSHRHIGPPNQVAPDIVMLPLNPGSRGPAPRPPQPMMNHLPPLPNLSQASPEQRVPAGTFAAPSHNPGTFQNNRANRLTFDFLQEGDNTVPGINTDSDFIDSLLKSGSGNDDWMKDINLDEILGSHS